MMPNPFNADEPVIGVAVDQGSGLEAAIRAARGGAADPQDLFTFKRIVTETISPVATTLLVDATYGPQLLPHMHADCIRMLAFEADVYHISDEDRITRLPDNLTVEQFPELGAPVLKFFLYFGPEDDAALNARKTDLVADIGARCKSAGVKFLFEPIVYDRAIADSSSEAFAEKKPHLVQRAVETFTDPRFGIDILKIEIPINLDFVEGYGKPRLSLKEAEAAIERVSAAAGEMPFVYLSAGVTFERWLQGLALCKSASGMAAGFMCGRALWSDAIGIFGAEGPAAMEGWMLHTGRERLGRMQDAIS